MYRITIAVALAAAISTPAFAHRHHSFHHRSHEHVQSHQPSRHFASSGHSQITSGSVSSTPQADDVQVPDEELDAARDFLAQTSCPGDTMSRQGPPLAIARLNPEFTIRLAAAHHEAIARGLFVCVFSAYRPPGWGVGGFKNKYDSEHTYGLAVDEGGLSREEMNVFAKIAAKHGLYRPYSAACEYNHFAPTKDKMVTEVVPALRKTVNADGPVLLVRMWDLAASIIAPEGLSPEIVATTHRRKVGVRIAAVKKPRLVHYAHHHHYRRYARA